MSTEKVDLVIYEGGKRTVIGEAVVDVNVECGYFDMSATVTDPEYRTKLKLRPHAFSFGRGPRGDEAAINPHSAAFRATHPFPPGVTITPSAFNVKNGRNSNGS